MLKYWMSGLDMSQSNLRVVEGANSKIGKQKTSSHFLESAQAVAYAGHSGRPGREPSSVP